MIRNNLKPVLTLYHWDLPSVLQDELTPNGWLNDEIVDHFVEYATLIFQELGQKLDYWTTFNEPSTFIKNGYGTGTHAPGFTNSSVNGYIVTHNVMRSHTKAVQKFREFRNSGVVRPTARIGIVLVSQMMYPLDPSNIKDVAAAERALQFDYGVYLQPMISGDYPAVMREVVGNRLPKITAEESALVKGSYDLFMMKLFQVCNRLQTSCDSLSLGYAKDRGVAESRAPEGYRNSSRNSAGELNCAWFTAYPPGYLALMKWMEQVYKAVTEENIKVIGYTAWSWMDNYEWGSFEPRFGLYYVDLPSEIGSTDCTTPKISDLTRTARPAAK